MIRSFNDAGCCELANFLSFSSKEVTVGVCEEMAKSEMHKPGGDRPLELYIPAA